MDTMSDTMVLKRKHSPIPPDWDTSSNQNDEPASPSSSIDEVCSPDESTKPKKKKKQVEFNGVTVYYFQRSQGFTCVPSQGGSTLGMEHIHDFEENYTLNGFALEQDRQHRQLLKEQLLERKQRQMLENGNHDLVDKSIHEIDAEKELQKINVEEYYFLQPVTTKRRRLMLRSAGVTKIESWEKSELKKIRLSREKCGCDCKSFCNPSTCACSLAGIKCQVDRLSFPCGCSKEACGNKTGRVEFNPVKVRTHFLHTLMRLEIENGEDNELSGKSLNDDENSASYTNLENSVCLDESSDRVLDHGQCKECDSIPYTDYTDQYTSNHYLNGQNKPVGLQGQFLQELDSAGMYSQVIGTSMSFNSSNTEMPLDLQSQSHSNNHLPCVVTYDGSKLSTLNSPANLSCNVPLSVMSDYESSTTEESLSSESESDSPYMNTSISLENTGFDSTSTKNIDNGIFQTPDSSPDQQYTKLMPLDLSHTLDDYEPVDDTPTYTQLNTSSRTCSASFCSQVSDTPPMSTQASLVYTDFANDCNHLPFSTDTCKTENMSTQNLSTIVTCSLDEQSDLFSDYTSDSDQHNISTKNNNCMPPMNHNKPPVDLEENMVEYFHVTALSSGPEEHGQLNTTENNVCREPHEFIDMTPASSDVELEKCLVSEEIPEICLPSDDKLGHLPDETLNSCHLNEGIADLLPLSKEVKDSLLTDRTEKESLLTGENIKMALPCVEPVEDVQPFDGLSQKQQECQQMEEINEPCLPSGGPAEESFLHGESLEKYVLAKDSDMTVLPDKSVEDSSDGIGNQHLPNKQFLKMCQQSSDGTVDGCQLYDEANVKTMLNESKNCLTLNEELPRCDVEEKDPLGTNLEVAGEVTNEEQEKVLTMPNETMDDCLSNDETENKTEQPDRAIDGFTSSKISLNENSSAGEVLEESLSVKDCQSMRNMLQESSPAGVEVAKTCLTIDELVCLPKEDLADNCTMPALDNVTSTEMTGDNLPSKEIENEPQQSNKALEFEPTLTVEKNQDFTYTAKSAVSEAL